MEYQKICYEIGDRMKSIKQNKFLEGEIIDDKMIKQDYRKSFQLIILTTISAIIVTTFFYLI